MRRHCISRCRAAAAAALRLHSAADARSFYKLRRTSVLIESSDQYTSPAQTVPQPPLECKESLQAAAPGKTARAPRSFKVGAAAEGRDPDVNIGLLWDRSAPLQLFAFNDNCQSDSPPALLTPAISAQASSFSLPLWKGCIGRLGSLKNNQLPPSRTTVCVFPPSR